jgi:hypothetical protein
VTKVIQPLPRFADPAKKEIRNDLPFTVYLHGLYGMEAVEVPLPLIGVRCRSLQDISGRAQQPRNPWLPFRHLTTRPTVLRFREL